MDSEKDTPTFSPSIRSSNGSDNSSECASSDRLGQEENEVPRQRKRIVVVGLGMIALSFMCGILPPLARTFVTRRDMGCNTYILTINKREINQIGCPKTTVRYCRHRRGTSRCLQPRRPVDLFRAFQGRAVISKPQRMGERNEILLRTLADNFTSTLHSKIAPSDFT